MPERLKIIAFTDGSGNSPRGSSYAAVLSDEQGQVLLERAKPMEPSTNNIAEYSGVILAIECALELEADELEIFSDSQLIVNQINEKWDVKDASLAILRERVWELASSLEVVSISWVRREKNKRADRLCRDCMKANFPK